MKTVINGIEITDKMAEAIARLAYDGSLANEFIESLDQTNTFLFNIDDAPADMDEYKKEAFDLMSKLNYLRSIIKAFIP